MFEPEAYIFCRIIHIVSIWVFCGKSVKESHEKICIFNLLSNPPCCSLWEMITCMQPKLGILLPRIELELFSTRVLFSSVMQIQKSDGFYINLFKT